MKTIYRATGIPTVILMASALFTGCHNMSPEGADVLESGAFSSGPPTVVKPPPPPNQPVIMPIPEPVPRR